MNASCAILHKHLCQFHDGCETSMAGIRIRNNWAEEIGACEACTLSFWRAQALFALFAVVEELCIPQMTNLVRYSGLGGN
jgi:hypothetical protein